MNDGNNMKQKVTVVIICEQLPCHGNETDVVVFSEKTKAEKWIDSQIASYVENLNLEQSSVDGWFVNLGGDGHTIQYDAKEVEVL